MKKRDGWTGSRSDSRIKAKSITFHNLARTLPLDLIQSVAVGLVYGYGAYEVINGRLSIGGLVAFIIYVPRAYIRSGRNFGRPHQHRPGQGRCRAH